MKYFNYATGLKMTNDKKWEQLFGIPPRKEESPITQSYMNMAFAIQQVTEDIVLKLARTAKKLTNCNNLVMAGGVALNSVANGKILEQKIFNDFGYNLPQVMQVEHWVQRYLHGIFGRERNAKLIHLRIQ